MNNQLCIHPINNTNFIKKERMSNCNILGGKDMEKIGLGIGVIGGIGLGLLLGSEFSGSNVTILGAILVVI